MRRVAGRAALLAIRATGSSGGLEAAVVYLPALFVDRPVRAAPWFDEQRLEASPACSSRSPS